METLRGLGDLGDSVDFSEWIASVQHLLKPPVGKLFEYALPPSSSNSSRGEISRGCVEWW